MRIDPGNIYKKYQTASNKTDTPSPDRLGETPKEGTVLKGQIVDASQNKVSIRLENGATMEARLTGANTFSIGEEISFVVKESGVEQVLITPLMDSGAQSTKQLMAILSEAGLPQTEENVEMLKEMINKDLPIDQETLKQMSKLIAKHADTPIKSLVFLTKHTIPVNGTTLQQLQMLETNEQPLMRSMASLVDDLSRTLQQSNPSMEQVVDTNTDPSTQVKQEALMSLITEDQEAMTVIKQLDDQINVLAKLTEASNQTALQEPQAESVPEATIKPAITLLPELKHTPIAQMVLTNDAQRLIGKVETSLHAVIDQGHLSEDQQAVIKDLPPSGDLTLQNLVQLAEVELISHEHLRSFMTELKDASTYQALAKGLLMSDLQVVENGEVTAWFEQVQDKVEEILSVSNEAVVSNEVAKGAMEVKATVEFINNLQQEYQFMQLPMFLNDQLLTSEFYVMNQQKATKDQQESITALVRLDLLNLGHTDIYVKKVDKNIDVQFYMTDESQISVMQKNVFQLHKLLRDKGFNTLSATVQPLEQAFDIVNDFLDKEDESPSKKRVSFDMRA